MKTLGDRLKWLADKEGLSDREFSKRAGLSSGAAGVVISRGGSMKTASLTKIAKKYGCSFEWLINGEGEPFPGRPIDPLRAALLDGSWPDVVVQAAQILASDGLKRDRSEWRKKLDAIAEVFETPAPPVSSRRPSN